MQVNKKVVIAVIGITAISIIRMMIERVADLHGATIQVQPITPIILGGYVVLMVCAILDLFGGQVAAIVGNIALLALFTAILTQFPWSLVTEFLRASASTGGTTGGTTGEGGTGVPVTHPGGGTGGTGGTPTPQPTKPIVPIM